MLGRDGMRQPRQHADKGVKTKTSPSLEFELSQKRKKAFHEEMPKFQRGDKEQAPGRIQSGKESTYGANG